MNIILNKDEKIASNHGLRDLTPSDKPTYIRKVETGTGLTTLFLSEINNDSINIIVTPTKGVILDKESQFEHPLYKGKELFFICSGSGHNLRDLKFKNYHGGYNIMCTVHQMYNMVNSSSFNKMLKNANVLIDEIHLINLNASFVKELQPMYRVIVRNIDNYKHLYVSTATPSLIKGINIDDISNNMFDYVDIRYKDINRYKMSTYIIRNKVEQKIIEYIHRLDDGNKIVVASNNKKVHHLIRTIYDDKEVMHLVGNTLETDLLKITNKENINNPDKEADIYVISSSYFEGFDIKHDGHVLIITEPNTTSTMMALSDIRQIIGRIRNKILSSTLFINYKENHDNSTEYMQSGVINKEVKMTWEKEDYLSFLTEENKVSVLNDYIYYCYQSPTTLLKEGLEYFNIDLEFQSWVSEFVKLETFKERGNKILLGMNYLINNLSIDELNRKLGHIKRNMHVLVKMKGYRYRQKLGLYNFKILFTYFLAYYYKKTNCTVNINPVNNKSFEERLKEMLEFIYSCVYLSTQEVEDFQLLYDYYDSSTLKKFLSSENKSLEMKVKLIYSSYPEKNLTLNLGTKNKDIIFRENKRLLLEELHTRLGVTEEVFNSIDTSVEEMKLKEAIKKYIKQGESYIFKTSKTVINQYKDTLMYLFLKGQHTFKYDDNEHIEYRYFSPLSNLPRYLRRNLPNKMIEIDISSANPTFIDKIYDCEYRKEVYNNIMNNVPSIKTRDEAKILYNSWLNNHRNSLKESEIFFRKVCGYPATISSEIARHCTHSKGTMYKKMVEQEYIIMKKFRDIIRNLHYEHKHRDTPPHVLLGIDKEKDQKKFLVARVHDALFIRESEIKPFKDKLEKKLKIFNNRYDVELKIK